MQNPALTQTPAANRSVAFHTVHLWVVQPTGLCNMDQCCNLFPLEFTGEGLGLNPLSRTVVYFRVTVPSSGTTITHSALL